MRYSILLLILLINHSLFSQSRINRQPINFINESERINQTTGWYYNEQKGEWVSYNGLIFFEKITQAGPQDNLVSFRSRTKQNYESLQFKTVKVNNETFYVLIIEQWNGKYKYPTLKQEYYYWLDTFGYIYTETEYRKLNQLALLGQVELKTSWMVQFGFDKSSYKSEIFLDMIQSAILGASKLDYEYILPVMATTNDNVDVIRFLLPDKYRFIKHDLSKQYFEINPDEFMKLILK